MNIWDVLHRVLVHRTRRIASISLTQRNIFTAGVPIHPMDTADTLTETEREALHELQLGVEHAHRGFGALLECHHEIGNGMDHLEEARALLAAAGHDEFADRLRDDLLPAGVFDERWTYELVEAFHDGFLDTIDEFEGTVRGDLADGAQHISERRMHERWRQRAESDE
mgnify:CR=1 FL=1